VRSAARPAAGAGPGRPDPPLGAPLVTGAGGFAGRHLVALLEREGRSPRAPARRELDLCDRAAVSAVVGELQPKEVFHLAAFSSPRLSWERPKEALLTNIEMTLNLLEAVRCEAPGAVVVLVGTGQVYGEPTDLPVEESAQLAPANPYAVSKATCDLLGRQYCEAHGLRVVRLRPFNHSGPGQDDEYVLSSLARQVAQAEADGRAEAVIVAGNVSSARDFTDVRDVVRAYALAVHAEPGPYNVCSGRSTSVAELIEALRGEATLPLRHEVDSALLRTNEATELWGSCARLHAATGWSPRIPLAETVRDTLQWWRARLGR
jgi:GDP-4-dehydro-6-deoxy-D-mannose reductase